MVRKIVPIAVIVAFVSSAVALIVEASYAIAYKSNFIADTKATSKRHGHMKISMQKSKILSTLTFTLPS